MYSRIYVEIGNICNKNCSFCHGTSREKRQMSFGEFKLTLSKIRHLTKYIYFHLMGEPLCHPEIISFVEYAKAEGFKVAVTTNGTLLSRLGEDLIASGVYKVNVSLHGFEDEREKSKYLDTCLSFADKASKSGVLTVLRLWNGDEDGGENTETFAKIKDFFKDSEWVFGSRGARIRDKLHLEYGERFEWPDINARDFGEDVFCYGLSDHFGILSDGSVVPCCLDSDGVITLGNIFKDDIDEILSSPRAENIKCGFKNKKAAEELCRKCGYARRFKV